MRKNRNTPGRKIAQTIIAEYKPQSVAETQMGRFLNRGKSFGDVFSLDEHPRYFGDY